MSSKNTREERTSRMNRFAEGKVAEIALLVEEQAVVMASQGGGGDEDVAMLFIH